MFIGLFFSNYVDKKKKGLLNPNNNNKRGCSKKKGTLIKNRQTNYFFWAIAKVVVQVPVNSSSSFCIYSAQVIILLVETVDNIRKKVPIIKYVLLT